MKGSIANITNDPSRALYEIECFIVGGPFDLVEDDRFISAVAPQHSSAEMSYGKLILSCWGEGWSRSWRVDSCQVETDLIRLQCSKRMGLLHCVVELRRSKPEKISASRSEFAARLPALIESSLPNLRVEQATTARDDRLHFSGVHTRLVLRDQGRIIAAVAVGAGAPQSDIDEALGAGLVWLDHLQHHQRVDQLMIFAPREKTFTLAARLTAIAGARVSLCEIDEANSSITPIAAFDQGDLADRLRRAVWPRRQKLDPESAAIVESIIRLAPHEIEARHRGGRALLSIRGMEFAHVSLKHRSASFGLGEAKKKLDESNRAELNALIAEIVSNRRSDAEDRTGVFFRSQAERWLESILSRDVSAIDPTLDPRWAYSQVPAYRGEQRTFIDLLAVTREGRLVVIELKVAEDMEFPFQGLDYWLRVEWHLGRRDFERRGYFKGINLSDEPPLLYLVAPLFRFHATTKLLAGKIDSRVPVYRVGINEDWRSGVRVLLSEKLNRY